MDSLRGHPVPSPLRFIVVSPGSVNIPVGLYRQFRATGIYKNGSRQDLTEHVRWLSSKPFVATVDSSGRAHIRSAGSAVIRAFLGPVLGEATLTGSEVEAAHLYVDNSEISGSNGLADFAMQSSGSLATANTQIEMGTTFPVAQAITPSQRWFYLADGNNHIDVFAVNQGTWALTPAAGGHSTDGMPVALAIDGPQSAVYTANINSNNISGFSFDQSTGALTPLPGSPYATGKTPDALVVDPSGQHVYVANMNANTVSIYSMNPNARGALVHLTDQSLPGTMPVAMAIDVTGTFLYVVEDGTNDVAAFTIDPKSGLLTAVQGSPFAAGSYPFSIAVDPSGSYLYVEAYGFVLSFEINAATGSLASIGSYNIDDTVLTIMVDPSGRYLYTSDWSPTAAPGNIGVLAINPISGVLTRVQQMPFDGYPGNMAASAMMH
jgi:6-phosphogluconolactonase (cycloisomerase 2 family)